MENNIEPVEKKSNGALIGSIIIIIILIIGGIYIWQSKVQKAPEEKNAQLETVAPTDADTKELDTLDKDINSAEIDLGASAIESIQ